VYALIHWLYPYADRIVAVSEGVANDLAVFARLPRNRIHTIYNPFDIERIQVHARAPLDHPWFAPGQPPVVLGVGRLSVQKDFSTLLRAFARLRTKRAARLMILGEGELRSELEGLSHSLGLTANEFFMPGFVSNPYAYYARCGVFVLSSRWEGLPGVLIEAMAAGAQVVATDCKSGSSEILENGKWGQLVPVGDYAAMADALNITLCEDHKFDVRTRAAYFDVDSSIDAFLSYL
jgi:glycosyltransferase involved in cell wall biosynthesis